VVSSIFKERRRCTDGFADLRAGPKIRAKETRDCQYVFSVG
jgi:hypothetical protein